MTSYRIEDSEPGVRIIHGRRLYSAAWLTSPKTIPDADVVRELEATAAVLVSLASRAGTRARAVNKVGQ